MEKHIGRITNKYKGKKEDILIICSNINYRLIINKTIINTKGFVIGDIVEFTCKEVINKKENYIECICNSINLLKKTLLSPYETAINESTKFNSLKAKKYFHTKMITDSNYIEFLKINALVINCIREYLNKKKFMECRTPIITNTFHGGTAIPFETYVNYKHKKCYLRANSMLPLSMYLAGGFNRVYEMGEYFRNGSVNKVHSVPYLAAEIYSTDINYAEMLEVSKELFNVIIKCVNDEFGYNISEKINTISFEQFMREYEFKEFSIKKLDDYFKIKKNNFNMENNYQNINNLYRIFKEEILPKYRDNIIITKMPSGISPFIDRLEENKYLLKRSLFIFKGYTIMEITHSSNNAENIINEIMRQKEYLKITKKDIVDKSCEGYEHALKLGILPMSAITISAERFISLICGNQNINDYTIDI